MQPAEVEREPLCPERQGFLQNPEMIHLSSVCMGGREHVFPGLHRQSGTGEKPGLPRGMKTGLGRFRFARWSPGREARG
ncbi:MAG: hypothetical protein Kow001_23870 [Acidobacteriota bacterium]